MHLYDLDIPRGTEDFGGALAAAKFLVGKPAGIYTMRDVIDAL